MSRSVMWRIRPRGGERPTRVAPSTSMSSGCAPSWDPATTISSTRSAESGTWRSHHATSPNAGHSRLIAITRIVNGARNIRGPTNIFSPDRQATPAVEGRTAFPRSTTIRPDVATGLHAAAKPNATSPIWSVNRFRVLSGRDAADEEPDRVLKMALLLLLGAEHPEVGHAGRDGFDHR